MAKTIKAKRATIQLGDIEIEGFMLPSGEYRMSQTQVAELIGFKKNWISELESKAPKQLEALQRLGFRGSSQVISIDGEVKARRATTLCLDDVIHIWRHQAMSNNPKAIALLCALAVESLERRFNQAFGVIVEEEEINKRLAERIARVEARYRWTDVIKAYQVREGYYYTDRQRVAEEYKDLTVMINRALFYVDHFNCDRDIMTKEQQGVIQAFETYLRRKAEHHPEKNPYQLVEDALTVWN